MLPIIVVSICLTGCKSEDPKPSIDTINANVLDLINEYRTEQGLETLEESEICHEIALGHSSEMAEGTLPLGHDGFPLRFQEASRKLGASAAGENVASNYWSAASLVEAWVNNESHRTTIEGDFNHWGLGIVENEQGDRFYTQFLVKI